MKNTLIFLIVLFCSVFSYAQNTNKHTLPLKQTQAYLYNVFQATSEALRVESIIDKATLFFGASDTVTTRVDTVTFTNSTYWLQGSIIANDSIEIAWTGNFTAGQTFIITETTAFSLPKWSVSVSNKLYIRRYGVAGTPRFYYRIFGN